MIHGSLFSGIGGFDLAAEWMGWENVFHCEFNPFCQKILKYYWPNAKSYGDIKETDFTEWKGKVDIISGGFPCQPFSAAGKRKGTSDNRYLWPEMLRAIREIQPPFIVGENVYGLVNWSGGMVFRQVQTDLENEGYEVASAILPACGKAAPHERSRIWFIAHANGKHFNLSKEQRGQKEASYINSCRTFKNGTITNGNCQGLQIGVQSGEWENSSQATRVKEGRKPSRIFAKGDWQQFPTVSPIFIRDDGFSNRLDGITISNWRKESISGAGNAVVPQIVFEIFKAIEEIESKNQHTRI